MSEGIRVPSKEWAAKNTDFKAVICLQYAPASSAEEEELRVGVMMVVVGKEAPQERELWELVRRTGSGGHRHGSLEFRKCSGRENFSRWSKSLRPTICGINGAKKPVLFLSRYLLSEDPTTLPFKSKDKGEQLIPQGCGSSAIESSDWKDLAVEQEIDQLIQTASFLCKELNPFKTVRGSDEAFTCFVLDKGRLDAATRHFHEIRKAVLDVLSGIELEREAIVQLCPTLSKHGGSAMAALDRVLDMDRWCTVVPGIHCDSEIQVYRRRLDRVPSYGLISNIRCKQCGSSEGQDKLALCDYCGNGVHLDCTSPEVERSFRIATEERRDWLCSQCATLQLPPPNSSPPITPPQSSGTCSLEVVDSDDAQEEDSEARKGTLSQPIGPNAADSGSDLSARMHESYHNKRAKTSAHVREEGLRNAPVEVGGAEQDVGQRIHGTVALGDCPNAGRQQQQGHIHSSSPQVEMEGEANVRLVQSPNPIACTPLSRVTANNLAPRVARDVHVDSHNERGGSREGRTDTTGNVEQRDANRSMSYTEAQLFPGDASLRWTISDVRRYLMNDEGNSRYDFLMHLSYTIFPKFVEAARQDYEAISDLVHALNNVGQLSPLDEDLEDKLFSHLCDLHFSLLRSYASMQSRAKQELLPKTFVLLDRVYSTPKRALTRDKLMKGTQDSILLHFLEDGS